MRYLFFSIAPVIATTGALFISPAARGGDDSKDPSVSVAAKQVRKQGYPCGTGISADKDQRHPKLKGGWILKCDNAIYHVHLVPRRRAEVERVD